MLIMFLNSFVPYCVYIVQLLMIARELSHCVCQCTPIIDVHVTQLVVLEVELEKRKNKSHRRRKENLF